MDNMMLMCDFYKISHKNMYPKGITKMYCTWTPRSGKYFPESKFVVWFGLQGFIKEVLVKQFNKYFFERDIDVIVEEYQEYIHNTFDENADTLHIVKLHSLGYLPIEVKALPEGLHVPYGVPCCTIENTHKDFAWVVNWLETLFSCNMWLPSTTATTAFLARNTIEKYIALTSDNESWGKNGCGDFSFRGMAGYDASILSGSAFLTSFTKTSTIPCIKYVCENYDSDVKKDNIGSWSASVEHSCTSSNFSVDGDETTFFREMCTKLYPTSPFSYVADTYDYYGFLNMVCVNKSLILKHDGCIRIRPDSGDPETIICGKVQMWKRYRSKEEFEHFYSKNDFLRLVYCGKNEDDEYNDINLNINGRKFICNWSKGVDDEDVFSYREATDEERGTLDILWETFGGRLNRKGYKVLNEHIGIVYGDSITLESCEKICSHMTNLGFAVENVVFGFGSYSMQYRTRDTQGWAYKATYAEIEDKPIMIYKNPKTGDGTKTSQKGMCRVYYNDDDEIEYEDNITIDTMDKQEREENLLETKFHNGKLFNEEDFTTIRQRIHRGKF